MLCCSLCKPRDHAPTSCKYVPIYAVSKTLVDGLDLPSRRIYPRRRESRQTTRITHAREQDQPPITPLIHRQDLPRDRDSRQRPKTDDRVARRVVPPVVLCLAELPDTDGRQADVGPAREAEEDRVDNDQSDVAAGREPEGEGGDEAQRDGDDHGVVATEAVGDEAGEPAAEEGAGVEDGEDLVGEGGGDAVVERVGGDKGEWYEEPPFDEEDADGGEGEDGVAEDAEVGEGVGELHLGGGETGADKEVADGDEEQGYEAHDPGGPGEADFGKQRLQHEGEDDAADAAAGGGEPGRLATLEEEEVADGGDDGREDEGGAKTAEDAEDDEEVPVLWGCD